MHTLAPGRYSRMRYSLPPVWKAYIRSTMKGNWMERERETALISWRTRTPATAAPHLDFLEDAALRLGVRNVLLVADDLGLGWGQSSNDDFKSNAPS